MKVLAVFADNGMVAKTTLENIVYTTEKLGVKLEVYKHSYLKKTAKHHLKSLSKNIDAAMVGFLCVGCRLGMADGIYKTAKKYNVFSVLTGSTPFEGKGYKTNLLKKNGSMLKGYLSKIMKNPRWILNPVAAYIQLMEFFIHFRLLNEHKDIKYFLPYKEYIEWDEKEIERVLDENLQWKRNPNLKTSWRGDCNIAPIKGYFYKKMLGFNDMEDHLSSLIRAGKITKKEGRERLKKEGQVDKKYVGKLLSEIQNS